MTDTHPTSTRFSSEPPALSEDAPEGGTTRPGTRPGEYQFFLPGKDGPGRWLTLTDRSWAADALRDLPEAVDHGTWPDGLSIFDVARALRRAVSNAGYLQAKLDKTLPPDADLRKAVQSAALEEFLRGWHAANSEHGPVSRYDDGTLSAAAPEHSDHLAEEEPPPSRTRSQKTGRMWWATEHGEWTDGHTVCSSWQAVCQQERLPSPGV
jgi:hypothetical protein